MIHQLPSSGLCKFLNSKTEAQASTAISWKIHNLVAEDRLRGSFATPIPISYGARRLLTMSQRKLLGLLISIKFIYPAHRSAFFGDSERQEAV